MLSIATVGLAASSRVTQSLVLDPLYTRRPLTVFSALFFSVRSIIPLWVFFFSSLVWVDTSMGWKQPLLWSWSSSFLAADRPLSPNFFIPFSKMYCWLNCASYSSPNCLTKFNPFLVTLLLISFMTWAIRLARLALYTSVLSAFISELLMLCYCSSWIHSWVWNRLIWLSLFLSGVPDCW